MKISNEEILSKLTLWSIVATAMLLAIYFGMALSDGSYYSLLIIGGAVGLCAWIVVAKDRWWLPFPVAVAMGGYFYLGFKIYLHEIVLLCCLLPLILNIAARKEAVGALRERIPGPVWILSFYIAVHWLTCIAYNKMEGLGGVGTVTRQYMNAGWPLIIFFAFYLYGNSKYLKSALYCMFAVYMLRLGLGLYSYIIMPERGSVEDLGFVIYIPLINYVPNTSGPQDLRMSTIGVASISLALCSIYKNVIIKAGLFLIAFGAVGVNLLGGGRAYFAICLIMLAFWTFISKKMIPLFLAALGIISLLVLINSNPEMIEAFPSKVQRSLSGLIFTTEHLKVQQEASQSNMFHERLADDGYKRWTEGFGAILVGHGIRPFDEAAFNDRTVDDVTRLSQQAMLTGRYECGLWTILATFGVVGMILYLYLMWFLATDAFKNLWVHGIHDYEHCFYFLASFSVLAWLITMPISGGFPSQEILMALFAKVAFEDGRRKAREEENFQKVGRDDSGKKTSHLPLVDRETLV